MAARPVSAPKWRGSRSSAFLDVVHRAFDIPRMKRHGALVPAFRPVPAAGERPRRAWIPRLGISWTAASAAMIRLISTSAVSEPGAARRAGSPPRRPLRRRRPSSPCSCATAGPARWRCCVCSGRRAVRRIARRLAGFPAIGLRARRRRAGAFGGRNIRAALVVRRDVRPEHARARRHLHGRQAGNAIRRRAGPGEVFAEVRHRRTRSGPRREEGGGQG